MVHRLRNRADCEYAIAYKSAPENCPHYMTKSTDIFGIAGDLVQEQPDGRFAGYAALRGDFGPSDHRNCSLSCATRQFPERRPPSPAKPVTALAGGCHGASRNTFGARCGNIVNPAKLPNRAAIASAQCHLEGEARILNPGKSWRIFVSENLSR